MNTDIAETQQMPRVGSYQRACWRKALYFKKFGRDELTQLKQARVEQLNLYTCDTKTCNGVIFARDHNKTWNGKELCTFGSLQHPQIDEASQHMRVRSESVASSHGTAFARRKAMNIDNSGTSKGVVAIAKIFGTVHHISGAAGRVATRLLRGYYSSHSCLTPVGNQ